MRIDLSKTPLRLDIRSDEFTSLVEMTYIFPQCFYNAASIYFHHFDVAIPMTSLCIDEVRDTAIIATIVLIVVVFFYKELLFYTFNPLGDQAGGLPLNRLNFGLMVLIALTIVASLKAVGVILVRDFYG